MRHLFGSIATLAASILVLGCSDSDSDGDTKKDNSFDCSFAACGGDLVGKWKVKGTCAGTTGGGQAWENIPACSDAEFSGDQEYTGTFTFKGNGSFTQDVQVTGSSRSVLDDDCLTAITLGAMSAEAYCDMMASTGGAASGTTMSCAYASGKCTCDTTYDIDYSVPGTYTTSGNKVTMTGWEAMDYCVAGNGEELKLNAGSGLMVLEKTDGGSGGGGGSGGSGGDGGSGGLDNGDACDFEACGGNPIGTWHAASVCGKTEVDIADDAACLGIPAQITAEGTGSLTYTASTVSSTLAFTVYQEIFTIPMNCLNAIDSPEAVCTDYSNYLSGNDLGSCSFSAAGCDCEIDQSGSWAWDPYPYVIAGSDVVLDKDTQYESRIPFCAQGNTLHHDFGSIFVLLTK